MDKADAHTITAADPVEAAARTCGQLNLAYGRLDAQHAQLREEFGRKLEDEMRALIHRMDCLKENASWVSASTEIGALFQLAIISEAMDDVATCALGSTDQKAAKARAIRCLHSVRRLLEPKAGATLAMIGLGDSLPARLDELATVERHAAAG